MVGNRTRWRILAALAMLGAGCFGLGDGPLNNFKANRTRLKQAAPAPSPELRMPAESDTQAKTDIPVVPVPSPPVKPPSPQPSAQAVPTKEMPPPSAPMPSKPDGSLPEAKQTAPPHTARQLLDQAAARCAKFDSYIVRLTRREQLKGKANPEEILLFKFRKEPFSVHFKWLGDTAKGREVIYVKGRYDDKIHTKLAAGDAPLMPAGSRWSVSPNSALARSASRHPITDAGICHCIQSLTALLDAQERGDRRQGTLTALAPQRRPEYPQPLEALERRIPPDVEPELPRGGRRLIYFDLDWQLPMLVVTYDDTGREVEYYRYDRLQAPLNLDDDDFNPDKLWRSPQPKAAPNAAGRP